MKQRIWQVAILTAAGAIGAGSSADAALFYWQDYDSGYYQRPEPRRQKVRRPSAKKTAVQKDTAAKPQGPLIVAVSIQNQKVRVYDANGLFAESPVSTGMPGHSTPTGIFSIIQKQKYHVSNIYSGAPMPYMQRITWSGVAMHAGVLPGYPASHGCIRMPMSFAVKMWGWTRMGARVVIAPGEMTPVGFSHPLLATHKVAPQPVATDQPTPAAPFGVKSDKGADVRNPGNGFNLDLRTTVGHAEPAALREQTHTADASNTMPAASASVTMSDAMTSVVPEASSARPEAAADADPINAQPAEAIASADKPAEAGLASADASTVDDAAASSDVSTSVSVKAEAKADEIGSDSAGTAASSTIERKPAETTAERSAEPVKAADAPAVDAKKDPARLPGGARPELPMRTGQIAVFISRKDSRLYVRQNFAPLFDVPVTIAPSERPLGTHVFTAVVDKDDSNVLRWSALTLPVSQRYAARNDDDRASRRQRTTGAPAESRPLPPSDSATEALDRITVPADVMAHINEALGNGGSIIVSDLGIGQSSETGQGTDFIIPLR